MSGTALALALMIADPVILGSNPQAISEETDPDGETLQGQADRDMRMTVDVAVQGSGPYRFLIDTGSQRTVVSTALAGNLGLALGPRVKIVGMAGRDQVATAKVSSLDIGSQSVYGLTVPLLDDAHIGADGIIGTDSLQDQRVLLDFTKNTITIGDRHHLGGNQGYEIIVRARRRSGRLIMTNARIDGIHVNVVVDTGSSTTVGNRALQRALRDRQVGQATLSSVTGHTLAADMGLAKELHVDGLYIENVLIAFADAPAFAELKLDKRPAIFLGMRELRVFNRIAIDFTSRKILFDLPQ
ncbi:aspartyl protease family protein [Novosphingobium malaysiense]|uniref:Peptidase A2 n=1 Tax=Novosphingobium malaysiense TaxID=1348853 RepID=A0A0B1ZMP1_9SPHN|nr:aspartyl protease family protein [Novosphingobium malaysiense]KHK90516.1 peptidase A2 [Novosphingobium malaysiense]